ncbi:MAG TPA: MFS transporter [Humisphaera sp.]|nr:MFS transporter [Humisphaera sp.]
MKSQRWIRIIPVALIMYTIAYVDRTNISLALDPKISTMMSELKMDDQMKGQAAGIFFLGYILLQIPGGYLATHWSARKLVAILLVFWGLCAIGCGYATTFKQFEIWRFLLGVAESGVFPATLVLLTHWFPRAERARANAFWNLCMPLSVAFSSPFTGWMLKKYQWHTTIAIEGLLPFIWLPIWLYFISDHPRQARWISDEERDHLETTLAREGAERPQAKGQSVWRIFLLPAVLVLLAVYFLQNCAAYGCMTFLTECLKGAPGTESGFISGVLFAIPYVVTAFVMLLVSWGSDRSGERRGYVALVYVVSGIALVASVLLKERSFWLSYVLLCLAVPGPYASLAPFWAIPAEILPKNVLGSVMGLINAIGNIGGYVGPSIVGLLVKRSHGVKIPFSVLGGGLLLAALLIANLPMVRQSLSAEVKPVVAD